jgi:hypothetical protein
MSDTFESWLESELQRSLQPVASSAVPPAAQLLAAATTGGSTLSLGSTIGTALSTKAAAGVAAATIAVAGGGYAAGAAVTGNANPLTWGQQVHNQVMACKQARASSGRSVATPQREGKESVSTEASDASFERGIGECVSSFARQNGEKHRADHANDNAANDTGSGNNGHGNGHGNGNGSGNAANAAAPGLKDDHGKNGSHGDEPETQPTPPVTKPNH